MNTQSQAPPLHSWLSPGNDVPSLHPGCRLKAILLAPCLVWAISFLHHAVWAGPISLHPDNPHYFLFRGRPTILISSTEHYGAVLNLDFDYGKYLDTLAADDRADLFFQGRAIGVVRGLDAGCDLGGREALVFQQAFQAVLVDAQDVMTMCLGAAASATRLLLVKPVRSFEQKSTHR